nr:sugar phosphate isomerase/epimerase [uncultured Schaedlerella sp.]
MDIVCSPAGIVHPLRPVQGIMDIVNAGFKNISLELDMCCSGYELEHFGKIPNEDEDAGERLFLPISEHPSEIPRFFEKMYAACCENHLQIPIARAPYLPRDTKRGDLTERMLMLHKECIRYCGRVGCGYITIRPFYADWALNRGYYLELAETARENHVMILLENQCRDKNGHMQRSICSDGEEAAEWVDALNRAAGGNRFGFCMDAGVCSLCGQDMYEFATALGNRIKAVVLRDCDGQHEGAMLPFTCTRFGQPQTDWLGLIRGLREAGFDGQLILHIPDTVITFSPLLRPQLLSLARAAAEYFKWQIEIESLLKKYESIVLFGAGNMCRNYLKCYGERYPPLFTCDNNPRMWGTDFFGLEVRTPEALKSIPEGCGVFICNIYYREIERQLRDMGIKNIEFFNDEYMPSFYFDRLKGV